MEPKPLGEEVVWPGSPAARSPHLQYPARWKIKKSMSLSEFDQACGRGLVPVSGNPCRSLHSTLIAPPWAAPRARAAIDSEGGASFAHSQRRVLAALHTSRPESQTRTVLLQR